jgi:hypothetical protein
MVIVSSAFAYQLVAHSDRLAAICELVAYLTADAAYGSSTVIALATGTTISAFPHCSPRIQTIPAIVLVIACLVLSAPIFLVV